MSYPNVDAAIDAARQVFKSGRVKPRRGSYRFPNHVEGPTEGCCLVGACGLEDARGDPVFDFWDFMKDRFGLGMDAVAALQNGWDGRTEWRELYEHHPEGVYAFDRAAALWAELSPKGGEA